MDPLPMLRALAAMTTEDGNPIEDEEHLRRLYNAADLTMKQKLILAAIFDLFQASADTSIVLPWVEEWMTILENQETCAICDLHVMVLKWLSTDYIPFRTVNDLLRTHMAVLDDAFAKAEEALEDKNLSYTERYELYHEYEDALSLLAADDTLSLILHDLAYIAPSIYDHVVEHEDDLRGDFPDWPWEDMV